MTDRHSAAAPLQFFRALAIMEKEAQPTYYGREPYWTPPVPAPAENAYLPVWNWVSPTLADMAPEGEELLTLDVNGAYLGAMGGVSIAHSHLTRTGAPMATPLPREVDPGYYLIRVPYWAFSGTIVSPLGDSSRLQTETEVWVAHPTLILLLELTETGALGGIDILDSWTAHTRTSFRAWTDRLKFSRSERLHAVAAAHPHGAPPKCQCPPCAAYSAFKDGYSAALSMMLTGDKCKTRRPDWTHAVLAQHAASQWRKAWRFTETGRPVVAMGHTDEITIFAADLQQALDRSKPPFRYDATGHRLGALKPKPHAAPITRPDTAAMVDDGGAIL